MKDKITEAPMGQRLVAGSTGAAPPADRRSQTPAPRRERYRDLFELAPEPYLLTDAGGVIRLANDRATALLGRPREDVQGKAVADFVAPAHHEELARQLERAAGGRRIHAWEVRLDARSLEAVVLASIEPFGGPDDSVELRWVLWDALPLELARERLTRLLEDSQGDAASMRALAEWQASLLGSAAQDMRAPLTVVSSTLDSLLEDGTSMSTPVARAMLERASRQVTKLRRLLPTLLQLGRLQLEGPNSNRHPMVLHELVDEVLHDLEPLARDVGYQFEVTTVSADPLQLARALVDLVSHVAEHAPAGTPLHIGALARGVDVELFLDADGYGMPPEVREVVFSPFLGTGRGEGSDDDLGLSLVAVFARMHGGRAWVQDTPDGGTSFRILLSNALPDNLEGAEAASTQH